MACTILRKEELAPDINLLEIAAPMVARKARAGQFIIIRIHEWGERIPLTVADYDRDAGTITAIFLAVGKTTEELAGLASGDGIADVVGPLGNPAEVPRDSVVVFVGGGVGVAPVFCEAREFKRAGNRVISILGARTADLLIWEDRLRAVSDELYITTDDGTKGHHGFVTDVLAEILAEREVDRVVAIGPAVMMRVVADVTRPSGVKTIVSLNPIMVDGTGMCGSCRVVVDGKTMFACVDGPEFDAHQVDFTLLMSRLAAYREEEALSLERFHGEKTDGVGGK
ncbi:ferredoxin-NADP reductase [Methanosarcinales archaeon ex4572_44]|nr:MAG: ferredoxin-NADP reductase [Methanosarcinales archaeon ex4484_138]PHP45532.1 MAG: ferredoxin-NADP reductase [Methanosarcinales archaeon ex4572_44]RLG27782.1 MAG: sulfide/dihydroorotate dehydrogenase-like FAD/NAD-binding protein [Methanosarcinales archaeon]RLI01031.1 MAG: sulfide/dihydroorotate dehydrogenase-like FAD/NAD-binding protein [Candidatus Bathyarchaeota archaeon]HHI30360.1 sulfide/dihydroorotate dehydrogenase-like FAD/NAD-binding protein [Candidatus Methanoperedenaceae archaeon]